MLMPRNCIVCGKEFTNPDKRRLTCGRACGAVLGHERSGPRKYVKPAPGVLSKAITLSHARRRRASWPLLENKDWLQQKYVVEGLGQLEIAKLAGTPTKEIVRLALIRYRIPLRDPKERSEAMRLRFAGENNWNWKGGIYNGKVVGWAGSSHVRIKLRKQLLLKRGDLCEWCGETGCRLEIHHVIPYVFSKNHKLENVVVLCTKCHALADSKFRDLAGEYFTSAGCPGLKEAVTILKSEVRIATLPGLF